MIPPCIIPARRLPGTEIPFIRPSNPLEHPSSHPSPSAASQSLAQELSLHAVTRSRIPTRAPRHPVSQAPDLQPQSAIAGAGLASSAVSSQPQASVSHPHFDFMRSMLPSLFIKFLPTRGIAIPLPPHESSSQTSSSQASSSHAVSSHASVLQGNMLRNKPTFLGWAHGSHAAASSSAAGS